MGGGSSKNVTSTEKSKTSTKLPEWVSKGGQESYKNMSAAIKQMTDNPALTPEQIAAGGTYVSPLNQDHMSAIENVRNRAFSHDPYFAPGEDFQRTWNMSAFGNRETGPDGKETLSFAPWNSETMSAFQNPWEDQVSSTVRAEMERAREVDRIRQGDEAIAASAFGGTGRAVESAELSRNWADKIGQFEAMLRKEGFTNAQQQFNAEREAAMAGWDRETSERATGADVGTARQTADLTGSAALKGAGDWQRAVEQAELDAAANIRREPIDLYMEQAKMLGLIPTNSTTTAKGSSTTPVAEPDRFGQVLGAGATLGGAFLMSDKRSKKNRKSAEPKAEEALTAFKQLPIDTFNYTDDAVEQLGMPADRRVGPMAQDYAKKFGGDGSTIDMGNAIGALMLAVKALEQRTRRAA